MLIPVKPDSIPVGAFLMFLGITFAHMHQWRHLACTGITNPMQVSYNCLNLVVDQMACTNSTDTLFLTIVVQSVPVDQYSLSSPPHPPPPPPPANRPSPNKCHISLTSDLWTTVTIYQLVLDWSWTTGTSISGSGDPARHYNDMEGQLGPRINNSGIPIAQKLHHIQ